MKNRTLSVVIASALGAFVGALIALQIARIGGYGKYLAWIGALVGGFVAYCAIDPKHFAKGVMAGAVRTRAVARTMVGWRPNMLYWGALLGYALTGLSVTSIVAIMCLGPMAIIGKIFDGAPKDYQVPLSGWFLMLGFGVLVSTLFAAFELSRENYEFRVDKKPTYDDFLKEKRAKRYAELKHLNPICALYWAFRGIFWLVKKAFEKAFCFANWLVDRTLDTPDFVISATRKLGLVALFVGILIAVFCSSVFMFIHSERRTTCFVAAAIGATIGYFANNAIVGAVAGGLIGLAEYQLIAVKWLKIKPRTA